MSDTSKTCTMHARSYDLFLDIDFPGLAFQGRVTIDLESEIDVILDCLGLEVLNVKANGRNVQFEKKDDTLVVKTGALNGTLEIEYRGAIPDIMVGIYRAPYNGSYLITTQFEAAHARRMFPCIDRPDQKAEFKLSVRIDTNLHAISNMPLESERLDSIKKTVTFKKTPRMSTYLLYLGIGRFDESIERSGEIDIIVATTFGKSGRKEFATEIAKKSIGFCENYFGIQYMLPKIHLVAVPEFAAGAMENWGAITFRETALQADENSSVMTRKRVAEVIAHELVHMWFGDLVTMRWWNDLWLNESFATLMAYKVVDSIYPQWKVWPDFLLNDTSAAMARDSLNNTHPIEVEVKSPNDIAQIFDDISYGKGACVLRMVEAYVGADTFRRGLQNYLTWHQFGNADGKDLWNSLDKASGRNLSHIMSEWVTKPGYPVISATVDSGKLKLRQERFLLSGDHERTNWQIPITMKLNQKPTSLLMDREEVVLDAGDIQSLNLNVDHVGFYRVHYQGIYDLVWKSEPSAFDRWAILFDALAFLISGRMNLAEYLELLKRYRDEQEYLPAYEASNQLAFLNLMIPTRIAELSREFHKSQLIILEKRTDECSSMLRGIAAKRLAIIDESYAKELASELTDYEKTNADMKAAIAIAHARAHGNLEVILNKYRQCTWDEDRDRLREALVNFKDPSLVALSLGLILSGEVKKQDLASMLILAATNSSARDTTWLWIKINIARLRKLYEGTATLSRVLLSTIPILGIGRVEEFERFFEENEIPEAKKGIEAGLERVRIYDRWLKTVSRSTKASPRADG